jgi:ribosomal protein S18 acetylase RimI-like enzyme
VPSTIIYRPFNASDTSGVNAVALAAFEQYKSHYSDWSQRKSGFANAAALAEIGEMIIATQDEKVVGAVTYVASDPNQRFERAAYFDSSWAVMRMLVVDPASRGLGIGHALAQACVSCGKRDGAETLALHTSTLMTVAQPMYLRMGFKFVRPLDPIAGMPYGLYTLLLA